MPFLRMVAGERYELITPSVLWTRSNPLPKVDLPAKVIKERGLLQRTVKTVNLRGEITGEVRQFQLVERYPETGALTDDERLDELAEGEDAPEANEPKADAKPARGGPKRGARARTDGPAVDDDPTKVE